MAEIVDDETELIARARAWAAADPDPETRSEVESLADLAVRGENAARDALRAAFDGRLGFGTAGLRGRLGGGPRRMNRVVVSQTSAGFAEFLLARRGTSDERPSVVIGYDGRVNSEVFARDTAEIMAGAGVRAILLPGPCPTPVTAFAVRHLEASAGVMITASHNPPRDNGYKVYLGDADGGSQIVPPQDAEIAASIERAAALPVASLPRSSDVERADVRDAYVAATVAAVREGMDEDRTRAAAPHLRVAYTAMHGVGSALARRVFAELELPEVEVVAEQDAPDGAFPTVDFPNPEEPGALDLALETARRIDAHLVIAHDPDADRLAVALPHPDEPGGYRRLSGNELGLLLGWRAAEQHRRLRGDAPGSLACTIVSSPALGAVARAYGLGYAETLSGFKWVSRVPDLVFGFEEALGYLTDPGVVRDKDGISASAEALALACEAAAQGRTLWDMLDEAAERFGRFTSGQIVLRLESMEAADALSQRVRVAPPAALGGVAVASAQDLLRPAPAPRERAELDGADLRAGGASGAAGAAEGGAAAGAAGQSMLAPVPANVLRFDLADGSRVMMRPSGTEPKLKIYLDTRATGGSPSELRERAAAGLAALETAVRDYLEQLGA